MFFILVIVDLKTGDDEGSIEFTIRTSDEHVVVEANLLVSGEQYSSLSCPEGSSAVI